MATSLQLGAEMLFFPVHNQREANMHRKFAKPIQFGTKGETTESTTFSRDDVLVMVELQKQ